MMFILLYSCDNPLFGIFKNISFPVLDLSKLSLYDFSAFFQLTASIALAGIVINLTVKNNFSILMERFSKSIIYNGLVNITNMLVVNEDSFKIKHEDVEKYVEGRSQPMLLSSQCLSTFLYCVIVLLISPLIERCELLYIPFFIYSVLVFLFILFFRFCFNRIILDEKVMCMPQKGKGDKERHYKIVLSHLIFIFGVTTIILTSIIFIFAQNEQKFYLCTYFKMLIICFAVFTALLPFLEQWYFYTKQIPESYFRTTLGISKKHIKQMKRNYEKILKLQQKNGKIVLMTKRSKIEF